MILTIILFGGIVLALVPVFAPQLGMTKSGRLLGLVILFVLPVIAAYIGTRQHIENTRRTEFCTSCHVMDLHGRSLKVDDDTLLAAVHYQKGAVPRDEACFACHTTYTMYGDFEAKLRGLRHVYHFYTKKDLDETKIKAYDKYHNRECLHCHEGTRKFEKGKKHRVEAGSMAKIRKNEKSCIAEGCHEFVHDVANIKDQALWVPPNDATDQEPDKKDDKKADDKKPDAPKPDDKKPDAPKADDKNPDAPKADTKEGK